MDHSNVDESSISAVTSVFDPVRVSLSMRKWYTFDTNSLMKNLGTSCTRFHYTTVPVFSGRSSFWIYSSHQGRFWYSWPGACFGHTLPNGNY
jgi:hypothetical protein